MEKKQIAILPSDINWIKYIEASKDGKYLYCYDEKKTLIWNLLDQRKEELFEWDTVVIKKIKVTNDNKYIIFVTESRLIMLWNIREKKFESVQNSTSIICIAKISDRLLIITCSKNNEIQIWDI